MKKSMKTAKITCDQKNMKLLVECFDSHRRLVKFEIANDTKEIPALVSDFFYAEPTKHEKE